MLTKTKKAEADRKVSLEIAKRDKIFKEASAAEKRVLIAKDVIAQVKAKKIKPGRGAFVQFEGDHNIDAFCRELFLKDQIKQCECCAIGGMLVSCTLYSKTSAENFNGICAYRNFNGICAYLDGFPSEGGITGVLEKLFSISQLRLIEQTFECDNGFVKSQHNDQRGKMFPKFSFKSSAFCGRYPKTKDRLVAIMRNIIKNNGTFKP